MRFGVEKLILELEKERRERSEFDILEMLVELVNELNGE